MYIYWNYNIDHSPLNSNCRFSLSLFNVFLPLQPDPQKCRADGHALQYGQTSEVARFKVHLSDAYDAPCIEKQVVSARLTSLVNRSTSEAEVECESPASYSVSYQACVRGRHELSVQVNGQPIAGSPFRVYIQQPPRLLGRPVRVIEGVLGPWRAAVSGSGQLAVTGCAGVSVFDGEGAVVNAAFSGIELHPRGIAVHGIDVMFVSDYIKHAVLKLSSSGGRCVLVGDCSSPGASGNLDGVALGDNKLFVCDRSNHKIHSFDLDLKLIGSFGSHGDSEGCFNQPADVAFDLGGNMYVVDCCSAHVQVFSPSGTFLRAFGGRGSGPGQLDIPMGIHVDCSRVYVSEWGNSRVSVFTTLGEFVTSFGGQGSGEGEFNLPLGIAMDSEGYLYVCDYYNDSVQVF